MCAMHSEVVGAPALEFMTYSRMHLQTVTLETRCSTRHVPAGRRRPPLGEGMGVAVGFSVSRAPASGVCNHYHKHPGPKGCTTAEASVCDEEVLHVSRIARDPRQPLLEFPSVAFCSNLRNVASKNPAQKHRNTETPA